MYSGWVITQWIWSLYVVFERIGEFKQCTGQQGRRVKRFKCAQQLPQKLAERAPLQFSYNGRQGETLLFAKIASLCRWIWTWFLRIGSKNHLKHASTDLNYLCDIPTADDLKQNLDVTLHYTPASNISWKWRSIQASNTKWRAAGPFHPLDTGNSSLLDNRPQSN